MTKGEKRENVYEVNLVSRLFFFLYIPSVWGLKVIRRNVPLCSPESSSLYILLCSHIPCVKPLETVDLFLRYFSKKKRFFQGAVHLNGKLCHTMTDFQFTSWPVFTLHQSLTKIWWQISSESHEAVNSAYIQSWTKGTESYLNSVSF